MAVTLTISDAARASGVSAHSTGMPIRQIRAYAELMRGGDDTHEARLALLEEHREAVRARLAETARNLDLIDHKIDFYRERLAAR